jgi:hypothetical protein
VKTPVRFLLSAVAALALLAALAYWGDVRPAQIGAALGQLPTSTWLAALGVHFGIYVARALRFQVLIPRQERPSFAAMLAIGAAHNMASYVLPAKSGEATLVLYARGASGVSTGAALASLLVSRALDLMALAAALAAATVYLSLGDQWQASQVAGLTAGALLLAATLVFFVASARGEWLVGLIGGTLRLLRLDRLSAGQRVASMAAGLADALKLTRGGGRLRAAGALSVLMWFGVFWFYTILAQGFGLPDHIGLVETAFGSGLAIMTNILPINALAGFGTQETGWVLGFGLLGVEGDLAFSSGVGVHLVQLVNVLLLGVLGHLGMGLLSGTRGRSDVG